MAAFLVVYRADRILRGSFSRQISMYAECYHFPYINILKKILLFIKYDQELTNVITWGKIPKTKSNARYYVT